VIPPEEALRSGGSRSPDAADLRRDFGVDAVITGKVRRHSEREGGPAADAPAAVWFEIELRAVRVSCSGPASTRNARRRCPTTS
jgi:hypothetical protein